MSLRCDWSCPRQPRLIARLSLDRVSAMSLPTPTVGRAHFGLDAPGVVRNLSLATAAGFGVWLLGLEVRFVFRSGSADPPTVVFPLHSMGPWVGIVCAVTGCVMVWYSYRGKLRMRERL